MEGLAKALGVKGLGHVILMKFYQFCRQYYMLIPCFFFHRFCLVVNWLIVGSQLIGVNQGLVAAVVELWWANLAGLSFCFCGVHPIRINGGWYLDMAHLGRWALALMIWWAGLRTTLRTLHEGNQLLGEPLEYFVPIRRGLMLKRIKRKLFNKSL